MNNSERINVTKTYLPPKEEYQTFLDGIWERGYLTNQGPLLKELEASLKSFLYVEHFHFLTNGTLAIQLALNALDITEGEVITTPFSYVATTSSILWERCVPVFVDIDPGTFCMNPDLIEKAITPRTKAILPVHVFGYPCDVEKIGAIAEKHHLKVIYDAAHVFGAKWKGKSLVSYGDISTCSFHSTKLFHTIEGGACIVKDQQVSEKLELIKRFGHHNDDHYRLGINAKGSEFQAAMGLCILKHLPEIIASRKKIVEQYDSLLAGAVRRPVMPEGLDYNYAYYPVIFKDESELLKVFEKLSGQNIYPRRYFYPSLNTLPYLKTAEKCPVSEDISVRIACLPLYPGLDENIVGQISDTIIKACRSAKP